MRVGFFTYGMEDRLTGIGRYARELTYALRGLDPTLEIILLNPYPGSPLPWYGDFPCEPLPALARLPAVLALGSAQLERAARRLHLDVLHDPCGIAPFVAPRSQTRRVVTVHDAIPYRHPELQPALTRLVFQTLVRAARWTVDAVVTVSQSAGSDLMRYTGLPPSALHVTPLGTDHPRDSDLQAWRAAFPALAQRYGLTQPYVLHVGAVNARKNIGRLLDAMCTVRQHRPAVGLVLVGPDSPSLQALRGGAAWEPQAVRHLNYVGQETLHALYANAAAVAVPSLYEGFGLPALEAMAHEAPVVASDRSSLPEVVGDAGILVDPLNTAALAAALEQVLGPTSLGPELARAGRERARRFTWEATARATLAVYEEVCARAAPARAG